MSRSGNLVGAASVAILFVTAAVATGCTPPMPDEAHFPLVGLHADVSCAGCHADELQQPTPTTCSGCHESARPDPHDPGECSACHSEFGWGEGVVDHDFFPLAEGHGGLICLDCHVEGDFAAASPVCSSCHQSDRPAEHFAGACDDCHDTTDWDNADFEHDPFFPTPHEGVSACASCHPAASDYTAFTCVDCHAHRRSRMDGEHVGEVSGYQYNSPACLDCHPDGDD